MQRRQIKIHIDQGVHIASFPDLKNWISHVYRGMRVDWQTYISLLLFANYTILI